MDKDTRIDDPSYTPRASLIYDVTDALTAKYTYSWAYIAPAPYFGFATYDNGTNLNTSLLCLDSTVGRAQASTTSGQTGPLVQGAVTTAAPTYTTAQTDPLSLSTAGAIKGNLFRFGR